MREPNVMLLGVGLLLVALALWLMWRGRLLHQASRLPAGDVLYSDAGAWFPAGETLVAPDLKLAGRPDYLVAQDDGQIVPVELKSGRAPQRPYESHVLQLAAYCLLVDRHYGTRPSHGILQYEDRAFSVEFSPQLEDDLLHLLAEMRAARYEPALSRDHDSVGRCRQCGFHGVCEQAL